MRPDLLGYLIHALEPADERAVEEYLEATPEARRELLKLRPFLNVLDTVEEPVPAPDLVFRTLRAVASQHSREATRALPDLVPVTSTARLPQLQPWTPSEYDASPSSWRRADAWALIAVVLFICLAIPPVLQYVRDRAMQMECRDNMREIHKSFAGYMADHGGAIPALTVEGPASHAGIYATVLREKGYWGDNQRLSCSGTPSTPQTLADVQKHTDNELSYWQKFAGSYAYHLGYTRHDDGKLRIIPVRQGDGGSIPILADRPARCGEVPDYCQANSPNHGCRGQNVLFLGGFVNFQRYRSAVNGEDPDIYNNKKKQPHAGLDVHDASLGLSEAKPLPPPDSMD